MSYSDVLLRHFWQPRNHSVMKDADRVGVAGVPGNGPFMVLYLRLDGDMIADAAFQTHGCPPSIALGSLLATELPGKTLESSGPLTDADALEKAIGGLPPHKRHCSVLAAEALRDATQRDAKPR